MANATDTVAVERELLIAASPETVWDLIVDPARASSWMGLESWSEPEPGGVYRVEIIPGNIVRGEYLELDPPRRVVFTWGWETETGASSVPPGTTTVSFELTAEGEGTRLRFVHSGLPTEEAGASHAHGWDHYFARLAAAAAGDDPGPDPWVEGGMS
jgi:uncharacterized protein YndB with AHSA1/START domain